MNSGCSCRPRRTGSARRATSARSWTCLTELFTTVGHSYFGIEYANTQHHNAHRDDPPALRVRLRHDHAGQFWQALQAANVADGSLARFLILTSEEDFPDSNTEFGDIVPTQDLLDRLVLIHQGGGKLAGNLADVGAVDEVMVEPRVVPITAQAQDAFRQLDQDLFGTATPVPWHRGCSSILARVEENATKLALIRAVSRDPVDPQIEDHDARWGILLARHCAELTIREVSRTGG